MFRKHCSQAGYFTFHARTYSTLKVEGKSLSRASQTTRALSRWR